MVPSFISADISSIAGESFWEEIFNFLLNSLVRLVSPQLGCTQFIVSTFAKCRFTPHE